jgi:nitrogen PTS system EIIA component
MEINDFLVPTDVLVGLRVPDKARLLRNLAGHAAVSLKLDADRIADAILGREELGSTGMGGGIAIPHARIAELKKPFGILACTKRPVAFDAVDGAPVDVIFMLLLPADSDPEHLHALASVARALRDPKIARALHGARNSAEAYQCLVGTGFKSPAPG